MKDGANHDFTSEEMVRCLGLYSIGTLVLALTCLNEEYKYSKVKLQMTLTDFRNETISIAVRPLSTGWKQTPPVVVQQPWGTTTLWGLPRLEEEGSAIQQGNRFGIRLQYQRGGNWWLRRCVDKKQLKEVCLAKQGQCMRWECLETR